MHAPGTQRTIPIAAAAILLVSLRALAGAATLESITVDPPVVHMRPCEVVLLEITGHYDDGTARDLELEFGLTFIFAEDIAQRSGTRTVVNNVGLDDILTVTLDGIESAPVPLLVIDPEDRSRCVGGGTSTTTTTTTDPPSTTTSTTLDASTSTTTTLESSTTTTPAPPTTTTTLPPVDDPEDAACGSCVRDSMQHWFRIEDHSIFHPEQLLQDRCEAAEFPLPVFHVAADGTQSSVFDVRRVVEGSCQTTLIEPNPLLLDENFEPLQISDPDFYGEVVAIDRRSDSVRFNYTHPTTLPDAGEKSRLVTIGIFYKDTRFPGGDCLAQQTCDGGPNDGQTCDSDRDCDERLVSVVHILVYRPPVVMIHGLWSDASAFVDMEQTLAASNYEPFQLSRMDYSRTNDSAFTVNYPLVADAIGAGIQRAADGNLAAGKVDLVTHSMGGIISRLYMQEPGYQHEVRRIITSNAPHAGSQMANLILDRSFDPLGVICSTLAQQMSTSNPNRSCFNGAVGDMRVTSFATTNFLNLGVHPTDVAVHAVATVIDPAAAVQVPALVGRAGAGPLLAAHLARACGVAVVRNVFNFDDSDLIVSATSQAGGLGASLRSLFPGQEHMGAAANSQVINEVKELLNEPDNSGSFTQAGYSPGQLPYTTPSRCPLLRRARTLGASGSAVSTGITITSPAPGTTITAGESVRIDVAGSPDIATIVLVFSQPGDQTVIDEHPGPDTSFDVAVPETAIGMQNVIAVGLDAEGGLVAVTDTVNVEVRVPSTLDSITVYPPVVYLRPCRTTALEVTGHYEDGLARDLSEQPALGLTFTTGNATQTGTNGVVLNEALSDTVVVSFDGVESAPVPIRVLVSDDDVGPCGAAPTTTTTSLPPGTTTSSTTVPAPSTTSTTTTTTTLESSTTTSTTTTPETSTTTTTTMETSTTTTLEPPTTTTTTLPPGCQADADCDDGDACTSDVCAPTGCEHAPAGGLAGAECLLSAALSEPLCQPGAMDPNLESFVTRQVERALELVQEAALATKPKRQHRLLDKAAKTLGRIRRHKPGTTTQDCLLDLGARIDAILAALS